MAVQTLNNRRIGRILINTTLLLKEPEVVKNILNGMIVVRAEQLFEHDAIEYIAIGDMFEEIAEGEKAPNYQVNVKYNEDNSTEISFERWIDG